MRGKGLAFPTFGTGPHDEWTKERRERKRAAEQRQVEAMTALREFIARTGTAAREPAQP